MYIVDIAPLWQTSGKVDGVAGNLEVDDSDGHSKNDIRSRNNFTEYFQLEIMPRWWSILCLISCLISAADLSINALEEEIGSYPPIYGIIECAEASMEIAAGITADTDDTQNHTPFVDMTANDSEEEEVVQVSHHLFVRVAYFSVSLFLPFTLTSPRASTIIIHFGPSLFLSSSLTHHQSHRCASLIPSPLCLSFVFATSRSFADSVSPTISVSHLYPLQASNTTTTPSPPISYLLYRVRTALKSRLVQISNVFDLVTTRTIGIDKIVPKSSLIPCKQN
jgi:hypothetical protein